MQIGSIIKDLRIEREYTQQFVSDKTGISRSVISQYENNLVEPTAFVIRKFAEFFGVSADYLLGLENDYGVKVAAPMGDHYSPEERQLIEEYRKLPADSKKLILRIVGVSATSQSSKKKA